MIDASTRERVVLRAESRCEYCLIPQRLLPFRPFHVEHIIARQHGGSDDEDNLCLSCHRCNAYKGPNLASVCQDTGEIVPLFDPRHQAWNDHFVFSSAEIVGLTPIGKATIRLLGMNDEYRLTLRQELIALGEQLLP